MENKVRSEQCEECIVEEYKNYYGWIMKSIDTDTCNIKNKRYKYLYQTYTQLKEKIEDKLNINKQNNSISIIDKEYQYREKFSDFLKKTESEYNEISQCKNKDYIYYDNLSSWYHIKIEITMSIIDNLSRSINIKC